MEGSKSESPMMPNDRGRAKGNYASGLLQAPAKIHVISGFAIFRIETAGIFKGPAPKSHITAGDVFRDGVGQEHMARSARRRSHTCLNPITRRGRYVWSSHAGIVAG